MSARPGSWRRHFVGAGLLIVACSVRSPAEVPSAGDAPPGHTPSASEGNQESAVPTPKPDATAAPSSAAMGTVSQVLHGSATYYSNSLAGRKTASGEVYDPKALTAAHRTLPFGQKVRVVRAESGEAVVVRINDRGPFAGRGRIIDLSYAAAEQLNMVRAGVVDVRVEVLK